MEKPSGRVTYIVVLEGLCRFSVQELSTRGTYHTARISSLEMTKTGNHSSFDNLSLPSPCFHFNECCHILPLLKRKESSEQFAYDIIADEI